MSFLFVSIVPLGLAGIVYYVTSYKILVQDTGKRTFENNQFLSSRLDELIIESSKIIKTIETDLAFEKVFESGDEEYLTDKDKSDLYKIIYLLIENKNPKVGIFVMNSSGSNILSNKQIPVEYDPLKYENWGIFYQSNSKRDKIITYSYKMIEKNRHERVLSISKAVYSGDKKVGYIIVDLYQEHFSEIFISESNADRFNIIIDENLLTLFSLPEHVQDSVLESISNKINIGNKFFSLFENENMPFLFSSFQSKNTGLYIVGVQALSPLINTLKMVIFPFLLLVLITTLISSILAFFIARSFSQPLYEVIECVQKVEKGDFSARTNINRNDEFAILGKSVNTMILKIRELISNITQKERSLRVAEMEALQAQIHPHLIFNTLEMIKWNIRLNNPEEASHIVIQLAKLLRQGIDNKDEKVTVSEEIKIVEIYLDIQKHRFEDKLNIKIDIDPGIKEVLIPKYIIQPVVENSMVHGLQNKIGNGFVNIKGYGIDGYLYIEITDNGVGIKKNMIQNILEGNEGYGSKINSTGLRNVLKRIQLYYGNECGLFIESNINQGTKIVLKMRTDVTI